MKQILQNLSTGVTELADVPCPRVGTGQLLIRTTRSLISAGTERMLVEFGKANLIEKARRQPDKVRMVLSGLHGLRDGRMDAAYTIPLSRKREGGVRGNRGICSVDFTGIRYRNHEIEHLVRLQDVLTLIQQRLMEGMAMSPSTAKERILEAIGKLPPDASVEDAIEQLVFLAKIERGIRELDAGKGIPHSEAKQRLLR